jgi:hypothetical protein
MSVRIGVNADWIGGDVMGSHVGRSFALLVTGAVAAVLFAMPASAAPADPHTCSGTLSSPGVLRGVYWSDVVVRGACAVNDGRAVVHGNLTVSPWSTLLAAYARHGSSLKVTGSVRVLTGAAAALGCEAEEFACFDDPHQNHPTLSSSVWIGRNLRATDALGVLVHNDTIHGYVKEVGGGGGVTCSPTPGSAFDAFGSPDYSTFEDTWIGRNLMVRRVHSCWFGTFRNAVGRDVRIARNHMADPDAMEVATNTVRGDMSCHANSPHIQFGDSHGDPNVVYGMASGQCGFDVRRPDPAPHGPLRHISVRGH